MNAKYIYQNALQSSVFSHFADIDGNWNGLSVADVFGDKEIKVGYVNGWLSTSQNMAKIFIVLSLVIILLIAPVFSGEYGGVDNIILTSKYGKTKCATAKVLASLLSAVFITTLVVIFNLLIAVAIYGTEGLDCSILFAPIDFLEGYIPFNITCGTVLKYQILLAFMSAISVTGIVLILSAVCKSQMIAFVISAAIHVIPIMLPISETSALYSDRRYYQRVQETGTYLDELAEDTTQPEVKTVEDFLDSIENQHLYQVLIKVDRLTLQIALMKIQGYSTREIAVYLDITEKAVYRRMDRLKEKLKKFFE